jgi:hypothetical protein
VAEPETTRSYNLPESSRCRAPVMRRSCNPPEATRGRGADDAEMQSARPPSRRRGEASTKCDGGGVLWASAVFGQGPTTTVSEQSWEHKRPSFYGAFLESTLYAHLRIPAYHSVGYRFGASTAIVGLKGVSL